MRSRSIVCILIASLLLGVFPTNHTAKGDLKEIAGDAGNVVVFAVLTVVAEKISEHLIDTWPWSDGEMEFLPETTSGKIKVETTLIVAHVDSTISNTRTQKMWYGNIKLTREDSVKINYKIDLSKAKVVIDNKNKIVHVTLPVVTVGPEEIKSTKYKESHTRVRRWFSSDTRRALVVRLEKDLRKSLAKEANARLKDVREKLDANCLSYEEQCFEIIEEGVKIKYKLLFRNSAP